MATSYPDRTNARGIWKLSDITKNIKRIKNLYIHLKLIKRCSITIQFKEYYEARSLYEKVIESLFLLCH